MKFKMCYECDLLHTITKAVKRPNGRALRRKERKLQTIVQKRLEGQKEYILKKIKPLFNNKSFNVKAVDDEIDKALANIPDDEMVEEIIAFAGDTMEYGAKYRIAKMKLADYGISFSLSNPLAIEYLGTDRPQLLYKMKGTVAEHILPILKRAVETGQSYNETALQISENYAFSKQRSLMIAVNEIGHAYEYGNLVPMVDLQAKGHKVKKWWSTVNDKDVTPECAANEDESPLDLNEEFKSGDASAPRASNPRCRCTTLYDFD